MSRIKRSLPYVGLFLTLGVSVFVWLFREQVVDWWYLRGYEPGVRTVELADDTTMTDEARRLFFVNKPTLDDKATFNDNCGNIIEEVAVLGCYRGDRQGIHLFDVTDTRLDGIEEVTAAHEMLHQAYDRLANSERSKIDALLNDFYRNGLKDQSVRDKVELYGDDGHTLANELHSIFGTEVLSLPAELEEYYGRYFNNRSKVVDFREQSRVAFEEFRKKIESYDRRLRTLQSEIQQGEQALAAELARLEAARKRLDQLLESEQVGAYNAGVPDFNKQVESYNALLKQTQQSVRTHNKLVEERNRVAVQVSDLNAAIDSRLTPQ